jgi:hypothetical protein
MFPCAKASVIDVGTASANAKLPTKAKTAAKHIILLFTTNLHPYLEYINLSKTQRSLKEDKIRKLIKP